ncbi:Clp protease N-terminal domain-containing protein [Micromonospora sp. NPDC049559]|uniref:Clp protease N-terminal domain-containing protein n=1 Tax=Micromonospora sp. NPDC049559 TaxID=3155923 RepID=UPI0034239DBE
MLERFTPQARQALETARAERRRFRHDHIGTEHLLLGLLDERTGPVAGLLRAAGVDADQVRAEIEREVEPAELGESDAEALRSIGIDLDAVRATVERTFGEGALEAPVPPGRRKLFGGRYPGSRLTPRARKVLELSLREALRLRHEHIGPEHILLGLLREGEGLAALLLVRAGLDLDDLRRRTVSSLEQAA